MKNKALVKYISALLLFGSNGIIASLIDMTSYEIVMFRTMLGSILLLCLLWLHLIKKLIKLPEWKIHAYSLLLLFKLYLYLLSQSKVFILI